MTHKTVPREPTDAMRSEAFNRYENIFGPHDLLEAFYAIYDAAPQPTLAAPLSGLIERLLADADGWDLCHTVSSDRTSKLEREAATALADAYAAGAVQPEPVQMRDTTAIVDAMLGPEHAPQPTLAAPPDADAHWLRCWGDTEMARGNVSNAQRFIEIADRLADAYRQGAAAMREAAAKAAGWPMDKQIRALPLEPPK